jgi:2-oxo-4-hydroxy-4-carboxy-5-ureidoimidazoline decarboxylase
MSVELINRASAEDAAQLFLQCCTSQSWIAAMVAARPYANAEQVRSQADDCWSGLAEADYLEAFDGHPKIGDVSSLKAKYANTKALAAGEQSGVNVAADAVIQALADGNTAYEEEFGFIFIVCATGKSAEEMSALLQARLPNDRAAEVLNAAEEQRKIFHIRLTQLLGDSQ